VKVTFITRAAAKRLGVVAGMAAALCLWAWSCMIRMPGRSFTGPLPEPSEAQIALASELRRDVETLGVDRSFRAYAALERAIEHIEGRFKAAGYATVARETYDIGGRAYSNLSVEVRGTSSEIVLVGAHYDSVFGCPGANDNASGTAGLLALARAFAASTPHKTIRFVAFTNEEPPHFQTPDMGSVVCARNCAARGENIAAMLSLETIGYYSDVEGSQRYPSPLSLFYPSKGDFIAFVGNVGSGGLARRAIRTFREKASFPSEGAALPGFMPGVGWSDHWAFWESGYPAIQVSDTAPFRYPHYHTDEDTPDKIDFLRCARVVDGLRHVIAELSGP